MMIRKLFLTVVLVSSVLSIAGCGLFRGHAVFIGGPDDMIVLPKGTIIKGVMLPTADKQPHDIETSRAGFWVSARGWNRAENQLGGSAPAEDKDSR